MDKGERIMAVAIRPLHRRRRTTQRGKPMTQSQRWGKVVTIMPTPEGIISTSTGPVDPNEPVQEVVPVVEELVEEELPEAEADDLPEL
jgi:hypothetical protein